MQAREEPFHDPASHELDAAELGYDVRVEKIGTSQGRHSLRKLPALLEQRKCPAPRTAARDAFRRTGRNCLAGNTLQFDPARHRFCLCHSMMTRLLAALALVAQAVVPLPRPTQGAQPAPCVACHAPAPAPRDTAPPDRAAITPSSSLYPVRYYPYRYAPGAQVVVTKPRTKAHRFIPVEPAAERLVPRLQRRKPPRVDPG